MALLALPSELVRIAHAEQDYKISLIVKVDPNKFEEKKLVASLTFYTTTSTFSKNYFFQRGRGGADAVGKNYYIEINSSEIKNILTQLFGAGVEVDSSAKSLIAFSEKIAKKSSKSAEVFDRFSPSGHQLYGGPVNGEKVFSFPGFKLPTPVLPQNPTIPTASQPQKKQIKITGAFSINSAQMNPAIYQDSIKSAGLSPADYTASYEVYGYASPDNVNHKDSDLKLSQARAEAVKKLMIANGFKGNITAKGMGQTTEFSDPKLLAQWLQRMKQPVSGKGEEELTVLKEKALSPNRIIVIIQK